MLNNIWKNGSINLKTKSNIYSSSTISILLYESSTWPTNDRQLQQVCLRRILKVKYFHHVTNVGICGRTECYPIRFLISEARLRFFEHTARMSDGRIPRYLLTWKPRHGNRSAGRQEDADTMFGRRLEIVHRNHWNENRGRNQHRQRAEKLARMIASIEEKIVRERAGESPWMKT